MVGVVFKEISCEKQSNLDENSVEEDRYEDKNNRILKRMRYVTDNFFVGRKTQMEMFAMSERIDIQRDLKRFYVDQIPLVDDETQDS